MESNTNRLNVRVDGKTAQELRRLVLCKHGKLYGALRQEIERAVEFHIQRLEGELDAK